MRSQRVSPVPAGCWIPLIRLYLGPRFAAEMDRHVRTEFVRLRDLLGERGGG